MYHLIIPSAVKKDIKKFDKNILEHIEKALNIILKDPRVGEKLKGDMKEYYSYHLKVRNVQYRIIYQVYDQELLIIVILIGSRENVYKQLGKRV